MPPGYRGNPWIVQQSSPTKGALSMKMRLISHEYHWMNGEEWINKLSSPWRCWQWTPPPPPPKKKKKSFTEWSTSLEQNTAKYLKVILALLSVSYVCFGKQLITGFVIFTTASSETNFCSMEILIFALTVMFWKILWDSGCPWLEAYLKKLCLKDESGQISI